MKKIINEIKVKKFSLIPTRILLIRGWIKLEFSKTIRLKKYQIKKEDRLKDEFKKNEKNKLFSSN